MAPLNDALSPVLKREQATTFTPYKWKRSFTLAGLKDMLVQGGDFLIHWPAPYRYGFALFALALATGSRILFDPILGEQHIFPTFFVALIVTTWFAGTGPGIMNLCLGLFCALFIFVHPRFTFAAPPKEHQVGVLLYSFVGIAHIVTNHLYRSVQGKLVQRTDDLTVMNNALEREIAERRRVEAEVKRLATIVSSSADAIFGFTLEGVITDWNIGSERLYGYPLANIMGKPVSLLVPPDRAAELQRTIRKIQAGDSVEPFETVRRREDGTLIVASVSVSPIKDGEGRIVGAAEIARDLTDTKRLEQQLHQAQKMEAIGRLAGGVAHDFNNILMIITGLSEMILDNTAADSPVRSYGTEIKEAADRAINLTKQLLAFSRKQIVAPMLLSVNALLLDMETMLHRLVGENSELFLMLKSKIGAIKADRGQIEQVIINLVMNARDAMPLGGKLTIRTNEATAEQLRQANKPLERGGAFVVLSVTDTGCGMSDEVKGHLFEPFFTTKGADRGTGLGLATVYGIVQQSGGFINVDSELGHGTTFEIYLPRQAAVLQEEKPVQVRDEVTGGKETILLVEDEHVLRRMARRKLLGFGYQVLEAGNGVDALEMADQHAAKIDLLITDVVMPKMSGRQLADRLRSVRPDIRVLFLSGYTDDTVVRHGVLEENTNFLAKPCTLDALAGKVREVLDGKAHP